jgi:hypothetical protein
LVGRHRPGLQERAAHEPLEFTNGCSCSNATQTLLCIGPLDNTCKVPHNGTRRQAGRALDRVLDGPYHRGLSTVKTALFNDMGSGSCWSSQAPARLAPLQVLPRLELSGDAPHLALGAGKPILASSRCLVERHHPPPLSRKCNLPPPPFVHAGTATIFSFPRPRSPNHSRALAPCIEFCLSFPCLRAFFALSASSLVTNCCDEILAHCSSLFGPPPGAIDKEPC